MRTAVRILFLLVWSCASLHLVLAQEPGIVRGRVEDPSGAVIAHASVKLDSLATSTPMKAVTDEAGRFIFRDVAAGDYTLTVKAEGFEKTELTLHVGQTPLPPQRVRLAIAKVKDEITVSARTASDPLAFDQNATSFEMGHDEFKLLPTKKDDPLYLANLYVDPAANDSQGTKIVVDGVEGDSFDVPASSIKTIAVDKNPYSVEFARPGKGRIEVTTRAGATRRFHRRLEFSFRDQALDARSYFDKVAASRQRDWFEAQVDGPVVPDKMTFFVSGDVLRDNDNAFISAIGQNGTIFSFSPVPRRTGHLFARTDMRLDSKNTLSLRYNWSIDHWANQGIGGSNLPVSGWSWKKRAQEFRLQETAMLKPTLLNQFVFDLKYRPKDEYSVSQAPAIQVNGYFRDGGAQISNSGLEKDIEFQDGASYIRGKHTLRFGGQVKSRLIDYTNENNFGGTFTFPNLTAYLSKQPVLYTVSQGIPTINFSQHEGTTYVQDEIRIKPYLNLLLGLRYELQSNLSYHGNFAPRIAVTTATPDGRTILRAGGGVFYERQPVALMEQYMLNDSVHLQQFTVSNNLSFPSPPNLTETAQNIYRIDRNIRSPYIIQASLGVERRFRKETVATIDYNMTRGEHLYRLRDLNAPLPSTGERPDPNFGMINQFESAGDSISHSMTLGLRTTVRWLHVNARYTLSHSIDNTNGISFLPVDPFDYALERGRSDYDQRHRLVCAAIAKLPRHYSVGLITSIRSGVPYNLTTGFTTVDGVPTRPYAGSPNMPFNSFGIDGSLVGGIPGVLYAGSQAVAGGSFIPANASSARWLVLPGPGNVGRNTGNGPAWADVDVRITKKFVLHKADDKSHTSRELEFFFDAFDSFNTPNFVTYVGSLTSPQFGTPNKAYPSRELQLSAKFSF